MNSPTDGMQGLLRLLLQCVSGLVDLWLVLEFSREPEKQRSQTHFEVLVSSGIKFLLDRRILISLECQQASCVAPAPWTLRICRIGALRHASFDLTESIVEEEVLSQPTHRLPINRNSDQLSRNGY